MLRFLTLFLTFFILIASLPAAAMQPEEINAPKTMATLPDGLKAWVPWVMGEVKLRACPFVYNSQDQQACIWPTALQLDIRSDSGKFAFDVAAFEEGWVQLPGSAKNWPQNVTVVGKEGAQAVSDQNGVPSLFLKPGRYTITGEFLWDTRPDMLQLPADTGVINLMVDKLNRPIDLDDGHQLWLKDQNQAAAPQEKGEADSMQLQIFRKVRDSVPMEIESQAVLQVSGKMREEQLAGLLPEGFTPMEVQSALSNRLETDGTLRVQVRPGRWEINVRAYHSGVLNELTLPKAATEPQEIWVFEAQNALRVVQVTGASPVDPAQTELPGDWRGFPAYILTAKDRLKLEQKKRGLEEPEDDKLQLRRIWRLDSSGDGYTVQDRMNGTLNKSWRLNASGGMKLGRVSIGGQPQFITRLDKSGQGVEVRPGMLSLEAESRYEGALRTLPAVGWDKAMNQLRGELYLPAGWSLFTATGVDKVSESWIQNWSLLDVFLVLIAVVATFKLLGGATALIMAVGLVLLHPLLPLVTGSALTVLAAMALLGVLPQGRFRGFVQLVRRGMILVLALAALGFMVDHMRTSLYPQLKQDITYNPYDSYQNGAGGGYDEGMVAQDAATMEMDQKMNAYRARGDMAPAPAAPPPPPAMEMMGSMAGAVRDEAQYLSKSAIPMDREASQMVQQLYQYDPDSKVQTGFGIPTRQSGRISLTWNGPVEKDQTLSLWLISPKMNLVLAIIRITLLAAIFVALLGIPLRRVPVRRLPSQVWQAFCLALCLGTMLLAAAPAIAEDDYPPAEMQEQLRARLTREMQEADRCAPNCGVLAQARFAVSPDQLTLYLQIHAGTDKVAVPLPGGARNWRPTSVTVDGAPASSLREDTNSGYLHLSLDKGVHNVVMQGTFPVGRDTISLTFPMPSYYTSSSGEGWDVQGIRPNGESDNSFQLVRIKDAASVKAAEGEPTLESRSLPEFFQVQRTLDLGLSWKIYTDISRLTPMGEAASLSLPLLEGESVISNGVEVKKGKALIHFGANEASKRIESSIHPRDMLSLTAPEAVNWVEVWQVNASNIWHVEFDGIPQIHQAAELASAPVWHPWPGETVKVSITRPQGVEGPTSTIDSTVLTVNAGQRSIESNLDVSMRSSLGGLHHITLPEGAKLQQVQVNGQVHSIQQKDQIITLPVTPGSQNYHVEWTHAKAMDMHYAAPEVNVHAPVVNSETRLTLPKDRWVLFTRGPQTGPAVLIWGWVPVILLVAFGLARVPNVPLSIGQWFLLLLGLSQTNLAIMVLVSGWILALSWRRGDTVIHSRISFNFRQLVLAVWTVLSLLLLFYGIQHGLLGSPDMKVAGNGSSSYQLNWYQDISGEVLPQPSVVSLPVLVYRILMLGWALWLAFSLVRWLKWGWGSFSAGGYWRTRPKTVAPKAGAIVMPGMVAPHADSLPESPEAPGSTAKGKPKGKPKA